MRLGRRMLQVGGLAGSLALGGCATEVSGFPQPEPPSDMAKPTQGMSLETPVVPPPFSTDLPAGWPADLTLPDGASIFTATDDNGRMLVLFDVTTEIGRVAADLDGTIRAMGYDKVASEQLGGNAVAQYGNGHSTISFSLLSDGPNTFGTIEIS